MENGFLKYGDEDFEQLHCCNVCGSFWFLQYPKVCECYDCEKRTNTIKGGLIYQSPKTKSFYEQKSIDQFGTSNHWRELFYKEELYNLPTFDREKHQHMLTEQAARDKRKAERAANPIPAYTPPKPKCPTCGSTNIQKISDLRKAGGAIMFGLLSTTARSQFECKNCGYKW